MLAMDRQTIERYMLECSVCMETFNDKERQPRILPCQHSFCLSCLKKMLNSGKVVCSQCRAENEVPDIDKLPKDNTRRDLMEILQKTEPATPQTCTMCDEGTVSVAFCEVCEEYMSDECTKAHKRMKVKSKHSIADIDLARKRKEFIPEIKPKTTSACKGNDTTGKSFCLTCDKVVLTCTEGHEVVSLDEGYAIRQRELTEMIHDLGVKINVEEIQNANEAVEQEKNKYTLLRDNVSLQFKAYIESLKKREEQLLTQLNNNYQQNQKILKQKVEDMTKFQAEVRNAISPAEQLCYKADREGFLGTFVSARDELKRLCTRELASPDISELILTRACTTEDFDKIVEAVGCFITKPEIPANNVTHAENSSSFDGKRQPTEHTFDSNESGQSEQLLEVLKSITLSGHPYVVSTPMPSETSWNNLGSFMSNTTTDNTVIDLTQYKASTEDTITKGLAALLRSPDSRAVIQSRFLTNRLRGYWQVDKDNKLTVYANSAEEGQYCRQIIDESVCTMKVSVRPEAMGLVHSDKWLALTRSQHQKYKDQIAIDVCHDQNKIVLYSFSSVIARDVKDAVNIFFRENDVRTIFLKFDKKIVSLLLKQKKMLKKYLASWSQYFVQVIKHDDVTIEVKGIGIGLAQVTRCVHELARKCASALENDDDARFDDDDEDSDDDTRFDDVPKGNVNVELRMETAKASLKSLSLIGDDRVVYVLHGDVTELPIEVIVNPADKNLKHNGGLAKILVKKGGKCIQEECRDFINQHGELKVGDAVSSGAGNLNCHVIVHAVGPKWNDGQQNEEAHLERAVYNSLQEANRKMLLSIAIPAIGAGTFGFPLPLAAKCIAKALKKFFLEKPISSIREVSLVDISMETVVCFTSAIKETYPDGDHIVSSTVHETQQRPFPSPGILQVPMIF